MIHQLNDNNPPLSPFPMYCSENNNSTSGAFPANTSSYPENDWDEDGDPLAHGRGGAFEVLAADLAASGR